MLITRDILQPIQILLMINLLSNNDKVFNKKIIKKESLLINKDNPFNNNFRIKIRTKNYLLHRKKSLLTNKDNLFKNKIKIRRQIYLLTEDNRLIIYMNHLIREISISPNKELL